MRDNSELFLALTGNPPFPWQEALAKRFSEGNLPASLDIPTGLGKTSVMAIWLIALANGARIPRRLVYIVDRRTVVDQATEIAMDLRKAVEADSAIRAKLGLKGPLPISTLRGKHIDNREWLQDPASPAIIVGTVDMIGSRLLFEGYGISRKMRPFHAGVLGADTLLILDEAHLVSPFEKLLDQIANCDAEFRPLGADRRKVLPNLKLLSLSATGRFTEGAFTLTDADLHPGSVTHQRLTAAKRLRFATLQSDESLPEALANHAWALASNGTENAKVLVFSNSRKVSVKAKEAVEKLAKGNRKEGTPQRQISCQLLTGARRVRERDRIYDWLESHGFFGGSKARPNRPTFVFATSAGEVGIDLDADHLACDLVTWERMVQRLGRVNRRGEGKASVIVVIEPSSKGSKGGNNIQEKAPDQQTKKEPFNLLPHSEEGIDVSPGALRALKLCAIHGNEDPSAQCTKNILEDATTPAPLYPRLSRALVDAWAMTSLLEHTGRPHIQPWLRGWQENDPAQTKVLWRTHLPLPPRIEEISKQKISTVEAFFEDAAPHASELLETDTDDVLSCLFERADKLSKLLNKSGGTESIPQQKAPIQLDQPCAVVLEMDGEVRKADLCLEDFLLSNLEKKQVPKRKEELRRLLSDGVLILDARIGGLNDDGLLDETVNSAPETLDGSAEWLSAQVPPAVRFRVRKIDGDAYNDTPTRSIWSRTFCVSTKSDSNGDPAEYLIVEKWKGEIEAPDTTAPSEQGLDVHQRLTAEKARAIADRIGLPEEYAVMIELAASVHDEGKRCDRWQNAFTAPHEGRPFAKTRGPINQALLDGYRHEFASTTSATQNGTFKNLPEELQDLGLHLITAHHGFGRPIISASGYPDAPPSVLEDRAREIALRFIRLQRQWGPWGLAWWEALLRAADQQASREIIPTSNQL